MTTEKKQALWIAVAVFAALLSFGGWAMGGLRPSGGGSGDAVGVSSRLNNYSGHETAALANETSIRSLADRDLILRWTDFEPRLSAYSTSNSSRINHVNIDIVGPSGIQAKTPFNFVRQHIYNVDTSIRVVIVGESTSNGYGLADPSTQCWPRKLADHFNGLGLYSTVKYYQPPVYRVTFNGYSQTVNIKSGIGGRTLIVRNAAISGAAISASHTALANWTTTANWNGMIKNVEPRYDVAIINVGHNNSTQVVPDQVSDYIKVINRLKTDYPGIEILICTQDINKNVYELYSNYAATSTAEITSSGHIDLQKIVAQGDPVNYCIQPGYSIHMTSDGHTLVADSIWALFAKYGITSDQSQQLWMPYKATGITTNIYLDALLGTDDSLHGLSAGTGAFKTWTYAESQIPPLVQGDVYLRDVSTSTTASVFRENVPIQGKSPAGAYNIYFVGRWLTLRGMQTATSGGSRSYKIARTTFSLASTAYIRRALSNYTTNKYAGKMVYIASGTGAGQYRPILSNTTSTLFVEAWVTTPDNTSQYLIYDWGTRITGADAAADTTAVRANAFTVGQNQKNIVINNIHMDYFTGYAISGDTSSVVNVNNCEVHNGGLYISINGQGSFSAQSCYTHNCGIGLFAFSGSFINLIDCWFLTYSSFGNYVMCSSGSIGRCRYDSTTSQALKLTRYGYLGLNGAALSSFVNHPGAAITKSDSIATNLSTQLYFNNGASPPYTTSATEE